MRYRVFGTNEENLPQESLLDCLRGIGLDASGAFRTDEQGWFAADLALNQGAVKIHVERFLANEDGIRAELNTWAAWAESAHEYPPPTCLMHQIISTKQLFAWQRPNWDGQGINIDRACLELCRFLADKTNGVYQVDGEGFFSNDGTPLVGEN